MPQLYDVTLCEELKQQMLDTMTQFHGTKEVNMLCITRGLELNSATLHALKMLHQEHKIDIRVVGKQTLYRLKPSYDSMTSA